jgi:hypothetical protein
MRPLCTGGDSIRLVSWIVVVASCRIEEWPAGKWGEAVSRETTGFRLGP